MTNDPRLNRMLESLDAFMSEAAIRRTGEIAEVIIDHVPQGPVRLLCDPETPFSTEADLSDYEIYEEAYECFCDTFDRGRPPEDQECV